MKDFMKNWGFFIIILSVFILLRLFVVTPVSVKGHSMDPTLADGQKLLTLKTDKVERLDIITLQEPDEPEKMAVKRVIALPGETVEMKNDQLTINGEVFAEPYLDEYQALFDTGQLAETYAYNPQFQKTAENAETFTSDFSYTVPEGQYFVLGDNRLVSKDSRYFGFIDQSYIKGRVIWRYWPLNQMSLFTKDSN
ncbi:MAG: signal peptidase I [Enterococcus sp.]|jgi:signal peptidase I|nr:signal peptidase I [Enterococcus sp.]